MGWTGEISTLEELEALMCGNILPAQKYPDAYYRLPICNGDSINERRCGL